ncbi:outer envelope pore protein 16-4, chloroplastic [Tanacetum coccineum]|uniref:Outer envelope pore protein 16-4, chloroplastic n=1 Tax=Tanacetum coccineum TaxID=301880 RepID=A0ABQ5I688_9ASTR
MDAQWYNDVPCSSIAVESIISVGTGGLIWGSCAGNYDAKHKGLTGIDRASFVAKTVGKYGFQCGLFAGIFSFTRCGVSRYRKKNDWVNALVAGGVAGAAIGAGTRNWKQVNALVAGGVAGAAIGAGTRNWKQVAVMTAFLSGFCAIADQSQAI